MVRVVSKFIVLTTGTREGINVMKEDKRGRIRDRRDVMERVNARKKCK